MKDLTFRVYQNLLNQFRKSGYQCKKIEDYSVQNLKKIVYLRHDVDSWPKNALQMAKMEQKTGIRSTFYFRKHWQSYNENIIKKISEMRHEIGYHYEDLANTNGDFDLAFENFNRNLEFFRKFYPVKTISMHGRPLSKWDSRDLWKKFDYKSLGIICEPYLDINYSNALYLTDTGGCWDGEKYSLRDNVKNDFAFNIHSTFDLIEHLKKGLLPNKIILNVHPARWNNNVFKWIIRKYILTLPKRKVKQILKSIREKQ